MARQSVSRRAVWGGRGAGRLAKTTPREIAIELVNGDVTNFEADVLAVKVAQQPFGSDKDVASRVLMDQDGHLAAHLPAVGQTQLMGGQGKVVARLVLLVGVPKQRDFDYRQARIFAKLALQELAKKAPETKHIALTIHGAGFGLDETEAFESELAGLMDAIKAGTFPDTLERISIVEKSIGRVKRLSIALDQLIPNGLIPVGAKGKAIALPAQAAARLSQVGGSNDGKPSVFVAMPFAKEMEDVYYYGIQGAVHRANYFCVRADLDAYTGDVWEQVKFRIETASFIVADLTTANPNVYLEIGYAWGKGKPTVLLLRDTEEPKFDVRGQKYIKYGTIHELEYHLYEELKALKLQ
jgi:hypothetical protein